jgi:multidrug efflux pump subunit AcrB
MTGPSDADHIRDTHNLSRLFVETPHLAWVLLAGTVVWGVSGYLTMPQRKDPEIPVKQAMVITPWPGASAEKIEDLVTRPIEKTIASNSNVSRIESTSRSNVSVIIFTLADELKVVGPVLDDVGGRLGGVTNLPSGAGPIQYLRDFGDTATLMLTVASPKADGVEIRLRAEAIRRGLARERGKESTGRAAVILCYPPVIDRRPLHLGVLQFVNYLQARGDSNNLRIVEGDGYFGVDNKTAASDQELLDLLQAFLASKYRQEEFHPDLWQPIVVRDPAGLEARLTAAAGDKYSYRELDDFTDSMEKALLATARTDTNSPMVAKVSRSGILPEKVFLMYSQERLASYGGHAQRLSDTLRARNITTAGGELAVNGKNVAIDPSGEFHSEEEIGNVAVAFSPNATPLYLRDVASVFRSYDTPARYLNFYNWRDAGGHWQRTRAITISVQMGSGQKIGRFSEAVNATLADLKTRLPSDLIIARTSDQPVQVAENVELFMTSLYEAVILVVIVSLIGFWEWRSAVLMALSIPITLLMTFGMMRLAGIDVQQVSIASLIVALGLLVDDPVVAGDAIKRSLADGHPPIVAAWLGPTKLATAILYATITNIVAYLPFLLLPGSTGQFLYSLAVVITCSLVASRVSSMTFIPLLGRYLLRPHPEPSMEERRSRGFGARYYALGGFLVRHRLPVFCASLALLGAGLAIGGKLKKQFFPKDLAYLSYVDIFLPEDAPFSSTNHAAQEVEAAIRAVTDEMKIPLESLTSFVGGGGPRFWYSLAPEPQHLNYAQVVILLKDKHDTQSLVGPLQERLSRDVAGARIDVRQLETGDAVGLPVAIRISGENIETLRGAAEQAKAIFRSLPNAARPRDDWGEKRFNVRLEIDPDRANVAGFTNLDVASASAAAMSGDPVTVLREGDKQIPVVARLRMEERAQLEDIQNLYVYSGQGSQKAPLRSISRIDYSLRDEVIRRRNQFRTITVSAAPAEGVLPSEVMDLARPRLMELANSLPPGYRLEIGGEEEKQVQGFGNLATVLAISVAAIFLALVFQFKNAVKPFIVFAAVPYGAAGALLALWIMGAPFGFMGFLGVISLVGVIVSHIIVLFDFIEEKHAEGEPFVQAVLDAGIMRLRPVLITVGATVIALFPLALHGGPLWEPLCYAQIGGLTAATFITLLLVPVIYSIVVLDLKLVKWETVAAGKEHSGSRVPGGQDRRAAVG